MTRWSNDVEANHVGAASWDQQFLVDTYFDYKDAGGAPFPMHIVQKQGGYPVFDLIVSDVKVNAAVNIQPPQGRGGAPAAAAAAPAAQSEKLGDGVYLITGGYAVIAVDFKDHMAIVESGQNEARGLAVIAEAKRLIPNKPIKYLINTHSHIDHSRWGGCKSATLNAGRGRSYRHVAVRPDRNPSTIWPILSWCRVRIVCTRRTMLRWLRRGTRE